MFNLGNILLWTIFGLLFIFHQPWCLRWISTPIYFPFPRPLSATERSEGHGGNDTRGAPELTLISFITLFPSQFQHICLVLLLRCSPFALKSCSSQGVTWIEKFLLIDVIFCFLTSQRATLSDLEPRLVFHYVHFDLSSFFFFLIWWKVPMATGWNIRQCNFQVAMMSEPLAVTCNGKMVKRWRCTFAFIIKHTSWSVVSSCSDWISVNINVRN